MLDRGSEHACVSRLHSFSVRPRCLIVSREDRASRNDKLGSLLLVVSTQLLEEAKRKSSLGVGKRLMYRRAGAQWRSVRLSLEE